jgi:PIN domain nuclease of toxin-antitoxin system
MKFLLDTHIWLWFVTNHSGLSPKVAETLVAENSELWLSPVSIWEFLLLAERGRIHPNISPKEWVANALEDVPLKHAPLTHAVALELSQVLLPHRDPADRFLVATARIFNLTLVTADRRLIEAQQVAILVN